MSRQFYCGAIVGAGSLALFAVGFGVGRNTQSSGTIEIADVLEVDTIKIKSLLLIGEPTDEGQLSVSADGETAGFKMRFGDRTLAIEDATIYNDFPLATFEDITLLQRPDLGKASAQINLSVSGYMPSIAMHGDYGWNWMDNMGYKMIGQVDGQSMGRLSLTYSGLDVVQSAEQKILQDKAMAELFEIMQQDIKSKSE